jgi:hypothetical protein
MSDQPLIPFKAKFVLSVKTTLKEYFKDSDEVSLKDKYEPLADDLDNIDIAKFISHYRFGSKVYDEYNQFDLKFHQPYDVSPSNMVVEEKDYSLSFKLESYKIEVLQITNNGKEITFSDSSKKVNTIELNDSLELFKV